MTEAEWLACTDPGVMLEFAADRASDRKLRLFACACVRRVWHLLEDPRGRAAVEVAERFADGRADRQELALSWHAARQARNAAPACSPAAHALDAAACVTEDRALSAALKVVVLTAWEASRQEDADRQHTHGGRAAAPRARENFPWPILLFSFRAWQEAMAAAAMRAAERAWEARDSILVREQSAQAVLLREIFGPTPFHAPAVEPAVLTWNVSCVPKLARAIYAGLAWDRLPVLADALEEAGCADGDILSHCRGTGEHMLGCWAVDALLGRA